MYKKAIIIDDEKAARTLIREYLAQHDNIEITGECVNGPDAVLMINEQQPDIIFLDIQMPGLDGFQVLQRLEQVPQVIFTTAYDQYAIQAFDLNAVDYLLKPYNRERFDRALTRLLKKDNVDHMRELVNSSYVTPGFYPEKIFVEHGNRLCSVTVNDIIYLKAEKDYTQIYTGQKSFLSSYGIGALVQKLNPEVFLRVHRSYIININAVKEIYRDITKTFLVMSNDVEIIVGKKYAENIRRLIY
jgi:two-component system LytT family response regulator